MKKVISSMLRPVIRHALRHALHLQEVIELIKELYIEEAIRELKQQGSDVSVSRISAMTGLHRKDVSSLCNKSEDSAVSSPRRKPLSIPQRILNNWQTLPQFCNQKGRPRTLNFEGSDNEFQKLVRSVSSDLNSYSLMFELQRSGAIIKTTKGLKLASGIENLKSNHDAAYQLLASDISDLTQTVEENVKNQGCEYLPNLHIRTEYDNVAVEAIPEIRAWLLREGSDLHRRARLFISQFDRDINPDTSGKKFSSRVVIGSFSITEKPDSLF